MKLSSREKKLLIILGFLVVCVAVYFYVIRPLNEKNANLKDEQQTVQTKLNTIKSMVKDEKDIDKIVENYKERLLVLESKLPSHVYLEQAINDMFLHFSSYDIIVDTMAFAMDDPRKEAQQAVLEGKGIDNIRPALSPAEIIEAYEKGESITVEEMSEEEKIEAEKNKIGSLKVNLTFRSNYDVFKDALEGLNNLNSTILTENASIAKIEPDDEAINPDINEVMVNLSVSIPFYYDGEKLEDIFFDYEFKPGEGFKEHGPFEYLDIIQPGNSEGGIAFSSIKGNFDIILKDKASDLPAQSFSTVNVNNSILALDGNKAESYVLSLIESNGKIMYKYKNSVKSYPEKGYKTLNIDKDAESIIIRVDSMSRINAKDRAGLNLTLNNKTGKKVVFYVFNDDQKSPRFNVSVKSGSYDIIRNR